MQEAPRFAFNHYNGHLVESGGAALLFHVPTSALFGLDALGQAVISAARPSSGLPVSGFIAALGGTFGDAAVVEAIAELRSLEVLQPAGDLRPINPKSVAIHSYPLSTIVLNVNTGCNLSCAYCYKEDLETPRRGKRMEFATAARSIDLLLQQANARQRIGVVFFGGEPLTNVALIREVVSYAERKAELAGKAVDFSMTTNATLLSEALIDYFDAHRFGISVSMDGPKALHDLNRRTVGGCGTYDVVARKVRLLLARYRSRAVGARVTLTAGVTAVEEIHQHLRDELGFHEVGYAPVTSSAEDGFALSEAELAEVHAGFERLGMSYLHAALAGRNSGFSNMHQLMTDLHEGRRKSLPCGAGVGLLAVDGDGGLNLCHRFTGSQLPTFGNVSTGINGEALTAFVERASEREGTHCATCRIRNLCAGGCYHEAYARFGDPHHRTYHYCDLLRRWVDFGIGVYAHIKTQNPAFFSQHIDTRSAAS